LQNSIIICPIGSVNIEIPKYLGESLTNQCGLEYKISSTMGNPDYAYNKSRSQYNSKTILKRLIKNRSYNTLRLIGVTDVDIYVPILKYVFGLAQLEGHCAIISLYRLRPCFYDQPPNFNILLDRAEKTIIHEIGHTFGLTHCRKRSCVMYSSSRIEDTDLKKPCFCPTCNELFKWHLTAVNQVNTGR